MKRFDYLITFRTGSPNTDENLLRAMDGDGWDLVSMTDTQFALRRAVRKMPKNDVPSDPTDA